MTNRATVRAALLVLSVALAAGPALAAPPPMTIPVPPEESGPQQPEGPFDFLKDWRRNAGLFGDMWGLRTELSRYGMTLGVEETSEVLGNVTGGSRQGFEYDGLTQAVLQLTLCGLGPKPPRAGRRRWHSTSARTSQRAVA